jgi:hypothetical protein
MHKNVSNVTMRSLDRIWHRPQIINSSKIDKIHIAH